MNTARLAVALLALTSLHCGPSIAVPSRAEHGPEPRENGASAYGNAMTLDGANDVARLLLESLLIAVRDEEPAGVARWFAGEPIQLGHTNPPRGTPMRQELAVQRILGARHASGLSASTPLDALIDRPSITTTRASQRFSELPAGLHEDDIVVTFRVRPLAQSALLAIALRGEGLLVVRVSSDGARIVAL